MPIAAARTSAFRWVAALLVAVVPATTAAQDAVLRGRVVSTQGAPVEGARVRPERGGGRATTDAQGRYRLSGLRAESTVVVVTRLGFSPVRTAVALSVGETVLDVTLSPIPQLVDTVTVAAEAKGIFGVVVDTAWRPIPGATIRLLSASGTAETDSAGRFTIDQARPGGAAFSVTKPGFAPRLLSATVPTKGAVRLVVWLRPLDDLERRRGDADELPARYAQELFDMGYRRGTVRGPWALITREQLAGLEREGAVTLGDALRRAPTRLTRGIPTRDPRFLLPMQPVGCFVQDGIRAIGQSLDDYLVQDVETVELYPNSALGGPRPRGVAVNSVCVRLIMRRE